MKLEYLPPYSPDFNPIEYSFSVIKMAIRKDKLIVEDEDLEVFAQKVQKLAGDKITSEMSKNQFRHCCIRVD
jgi:transposase